MSGGNSPRRVMNEPGVAVERGKAIMRNWLVGALVCGAAVARPLAAQCGGEERWAVKMAADPGSSQIALQHPPPPPPRPAARAVLARRPRGAAPLRFPRPPAPPPRRVGGPPRGGAGGRGGGF